MAVKTKPLPREVFKKLADRARRNAKDRKPDLPSSDWTFGDYLALFIIPLHPYLLGPVGIYFTYKSAYTELCDKIYMSEFRKYYYSFHKKTYYT